MLAEKTMFILFQPHLAHLPEGGADDQMICIEPEERFYVELRILTDF